MLRSLFFWLTLVTVTIVCALAACCLFFWDRGFLFFAWLWARLICAAAGVEVECIHRVPLPQGPAIYMFNHASNFDIFALSQNIPPRTG